MSVEFTLHDPSTAPEESRKPLEMAGEKLGMIPNLYRVMAEAPSLLKGYLTLTEILGDASLSPTQQQVVFQTANFENDCHYCVPAHTAISKRVGMDEKAIDALRNGTEIPDAKLEALHRFARALLENRGHVDDAQVRRFLEAGYAKRHVLEVITCLALKVMSNYTNALANTPLDNAFSGFLWIKPETLEEKYNERIEHM